MMRYIMRNIVVVLVCILLIMHPSNFVFSSQSVLNTSESDNTPILCMSDGTIAFEAENMSYAETMLLVEDNTTSGGKALRVWGKYTPQADRTQPDENEDPDVGIEFVSDTSEPVYLWARLKTPNTGADSFFYSVNNSEYIAKHFNSGILDDASIYYWVLISSFESFCEGQKASFKIQYREPNVYIDKFIFTTDMYFAPVGMNDMPTGEGADYSDLFPSPPLIPAEGHPRLVFTKNDIHSILKNAEHINMRRVYFETAEKADTIVDGKLNTSLNRNYNSVMLNVITCRALFYALGLRDTQHGIKTVEIMKDYLDTVRFDLSLADETRSVGSVMMTAAVVYDWCFDLLTDDDKGYFISKMKYLANKTEVGYPPTKQQSIFGHGGEGEIFAYPLACGIAVYDEDPEMYNLAAGRMFSELTQARIMWNKTGTHPVGYSYGLTRFDWETMANLFYLRMGKGSIIGDADDIAEVAKSFIYRRLPTGTHIKSGDDYAWSAWTPQTWWRTTDTSFAFVSGQTEDPYIQQASLINKFISGYAETYKTIIPDLVLTNPEAEGEFMDTLPLAKKSSYPLSSITARTNWKLGTASNAAVAYFEAREKQYSDHAHADLGSFQIYYKGYLAINAGSYNGKTGGWGTDHYRNYYTRTIAHNAMTVFDPNETTWGSLANDGGQKQSPDLYLYEEYLAQEDEAETEAWYIGPNTDTPEFSFIKTNITNAYGGDKVTNHERSMVFMDLDNDDYPAAVVVFDDISSSDPAFKKTWIMNTVAEPEISGDTTVVSRTDNGYNGKLVNKTLLPQNPAITTVGGEGKESFVNGVNYPNEDIDDSYDSEQGNWRIEISPAESNKRDLFLNAMYVTDYDRNLPTLTMHKEETDILAGVTVADRSVYFSKADTIYSSFEVELRDNGYDTVKCLVTDIEPGLWKVSSSDGSFKVYMADDEKNSLYFRASPGIYTISKQTSGEADQIVYEEMNKPKYGEFLIYNPESSQFLPSDNPTVVQNGLKLVPLEETVRYVGGEYNRDGDSITVSIDNVVCHLSLGSREARFNENNVVILTAPLEIDGVVYVNCDDLWNTSYDRWAKIISLDTFRTYDENAQTDIITNICLMQNNNTICDIREFDWTKELTVSGYIPKITCSSSLKLICAVKKNSQLFAISMDDITCDGNSAKFELSLKGLPSDIVSDDYEIMLFAWNSEMSPCFKAIDLSNDLQG